MYLLHLQLLELAIVFILIIIYNIHIKMNINYFGTAIPGGYIIKGQCRLDTLFAKTDGNPTSTLVIFFYILIISYKGSLYTLFFCFL